MKKLKKYWKDGRNCRKELISANISILNLTNNYSNMDNTWLPVPNKTVIKEKVRQLQYNKDLNLYKRKRTFDGIYHLHNWTIISDYIDLKKPMKCLEIGSHEGQSAMYFLKYILTHTESSLICCDPWIKSHWLNIKPTNLCYEDVFNFNVVNNNGTNKIIKYQGTNNKLYLESWFKKCIFDIVYIDDIHTYESTVLNINNCWPQLKTGGIMIFDDYEKEHAIYDKTDAVKWCDPVKKAVSEFIKRDKKNIKILFKHYQLIIQKIY